MAPVDIVILSNAPGEIITWVRPVVKQLRQQLGNNVARVRISVVLSPCPHSTGKEAAIALSYPQVDRVLPAEDFWQFLLWGKTRENWGWRRRGVVIFLGGDQFYTVVIGKRLGYSTLVYAEWDARWYRWIDRFAVMNQTVAEKIPRACRHKCTVVGDLIADVALEVSGDRRKDSQTPLIGLLVGSKPAKLAQGVPLCLAITEKIRQQLPQARFIIPVAPTLDLTTLAKYAAPRTNNLISQLGKVSGKLILTTTFPYLVTSGGTKISLITEFPAYETLSQCQLCVTTVGANTAELASLAIPMLVLLPTQQLDAMRAWDGLPGVLANLPGVGAILAKSINWLVLRQRRLFAWPNIWAKAEIVPELVGKLSPETVANLALDYLQYPQKLQTMSDRLRRVRGTSGAAEQLAIMVKYQLQ
ncbi:lipid-A-disaccharide synthase [Myxosarcina sp. GI1(2024)]